MVGKQIAHYKITGELGGGGMGVVYEAEDTKLGRAVALKVISPQRSVSKKDKARLLREAQAAAALRHPNICTVFEIGEEGDIAFISMDLVPGRGLEKLIEDGPLEVRRALKIVYQVAEGLQAAHDKNIIHRDIKCSNIMVGEDDGATILDFGIAKSPGKSQTGEGTTLGTIGYMSPEQTQGHRVDRRTDIWSLGVCLYEVLTGRLPFEGPHESAVVYQIVNQNPPSLTSLGLDVPKSVSRVIGRALEKDPNDRYQLVDQMLADLKLAIRDLESGDAADRAWQPSIAVLPFTNMSSDKDQDYFCDGIAEDIITSLSQIEGLRVVARTSSFSFRDTRSDVRDVGRKLNVDTILEGSVRKSGNQLRITGQLINVDDGYHLWSERYDRSLEDVFAIQDEIGHNIVQALKVTLTDREKRAMERVPTTDMEAYEFYIRGRQHFFSMGSKGLEYARNMFTNAIIRDPRYALAFCGLADCYSLIYQYYDSHRSNVENALTASRKALELDSELAEAHASYGLAVSIDNRYEEAEKEFERAIGLSPKLFEAYYFYARASRSQGKLEKAADLFSMAGAVRPDDFQSPILAGDTYRGLNRPERMKQSFRRGLDVAKAHLEFHPKDARAWYLGAHANLELGDRDEALRWCEKSMKLAPEDAATLYNAGCLFSIMGEIEKCFECLEASVELGFGHPQWLETDPDLAGIRDDPRYKKMLDRLND